VCSAVTEAPPGGCIDAFNMQGHAHTCTQLQNICIYAHNTFALRTMSYCVLSFPGIKNSSTLQLEIIDTKPSRAYTREHAEAEQR
jgi:hypothetical protein